MSLSAASLHTCFLTRAEHLLPNPPCAYKERKRSKRSCFKSSPKLSVEAAPCSVCVAILLEKTAAKNSQGQRFLDLWNWEVPGKALCWLNSCFETFCPASEFLGITFFLSCLPGNAYRRTWWKRCRQWQFVVLDKLITTENLKNSCQDISWGWSWVVQGSLLSNMPDCPLSTLSKISFGACHLV